VTLYSQTVGHAGSRTRIVYVVVILTRSKLKVKITSFWSSEILHAGRGYNHVIVIAGGPQQAVHAGYDDRQPPPLRGFFY